MKKVIAVCVSVIAFFFLFQIYTSSERRNAYDEAAEIYESEISNLTDRITNLESQNRDLSESLLSYQDEYDLQYYYESKYDSLREQLDYYDLLYGPVPSSESESSTDDISSSDTSSADDGSLSLDNTVYYTGTGSMYHSLGCVYLQYNKYELTVDQAIQRGLRPCPLCFDSDSSQSSTSRSDNSTSEYQYYTNGNNTKYHDNPDCDYLNINCVPVTAEYVLAHNLIPCSSCFGSTTTTRASSQSSTNTSSVSNVPITSVPSPPASTGNSSSYSEPSSVTVYITATGEKYHRSNCSYLKYSKYAIDKSYAISQGYTACSHCNP